MVEPTPIRLRERSTFFGDVLSAISAEKKFNQYQLSVETGYSQPAISRIEKGQRSLTPKLASRLEAVLGGSVEKWLQVYEETKLGNDLPVNFFRDFLIGEAIEDDLPGMRIRRIFDEDLIKFFGDNEDGRVEFRGVEEDAEISNFDPSRVTKTSYDTRIGAYYDPHHDFTPIIVGEGGEFELPAGSSRLICSFEHVTLPSWLEAEIHPATNIVMKGLFVSHGASIEPGWQGYLKVSVFNPMPHGVMLSADDPFLTLRFWMQDGH